MKQQYKISLLLIAAVFAFAINFSCKKMRFTTSPAVVIPLQPPVACNDSNRPQINAQLIPVGKLSQARSLMAVASTGNKILFAGGITPSGINSSRVDMYDLTTQTWTTAELSVGRYIISAVANGNKIFFGGGEVSDGTFPVNTVDVYDLSTNTWTTSALSAPGYDMATAAVGDKVFFAGGEQGFAPGLPGVPRNKTVDIYDLSTGTWSRALMSNTRTGGLVAVTANNKLYIAGGETLSSSRMVDIYDNATNAWSTSSLLQGKFYLGGLAVNNKIYWAGGSTADSPNALTCSVEVKDVSTGSSSVQYLSKATRWSRAVAKGDKILFFGGTSLDYNTDKFDIYDITLNTWSTGLLPFSINISTSIISVNNIVYVAGGGLGASSNQVWKLEF
jgi:N-acetylneuraminic acid mutarotase